METAEQAQATRELGADWAQGWHYGRPQAAADIAAQSGVGAAV